MEHNKKIVYKWKVIEMMIMMMNNYELQEKELSHLEQSMIYKRNEESNTRICNSTKSI